MYIARVKQKRPLAAGVLLFIARVLPSVEPPVARGPYQWALVSGALAFFIVLSTGTKAQGMAIVGLGMGVFLALGRILLQRRRGQR
jgi:hypothetical protein